MSPHTQRCPADSDKLGTYFYALGRPQAIRRNTYNVELLPVFNNYGSKNLFNAGQAISIGLADVMRDILDKVNGVYIYKLIYIRCIGQPVLRHGTIQPRYLSQDGS